MVMVRLPPKRRNVAWSRGAVILPRAVEAFRRRVLAQYDWVKTCTRDELLQELQGVQFYGVSPWTHQLACTLLLLSIPRLLLFLDMGAGKTRIVLDALRHRKVHRVLVLMPSGTNIPGWLDQIRQHRPEFKAVALEGAGDERREQLLRAVDAGSNLFLLNYDGLLSYMTRLVAKEGRELDHKRAEEFAALFDAVILDEVHLVGNRNSLRFRMCSILSKRASVMYGLTGTPFGRNPERLWSQFYLIDHGETLGPTLGMYRAAFFTATENYWGGMEYKFDERHTERLRTTLCNRSIRYADHELADLPKCVHKTHRVVLTNEAEEHYKRVIGELRAAHKAGALRELENSFLRARQICAGFLTVTNEELDEKLRVSFSSNPKLDELESLLDGLPDDEKVIVFHEFVLSGDAIAEMLTRKKIKWVRVGGGAKGNRPAQSMRAFLDNSQTRVLLANNHSGATTGINPQHVCRRIVFFDSPVDPIVRQQAERRVLRSGQKRHVYIHDLVGAGSVDETVLTFIKQGKDLMKAVIDGGSDVL